MYNNIGKKIKGFAIVLAVVLTVVYVFCGIAMIAGFSSSQSQQGGAGIAGGVIIMLLGPVIAWISSWFLYGYGELVDKMAEIKKNTDYMAKLIEVHIKTQNNITENQ